jgi:hypothetical protein
MASKAKLNGTQQNKPCINPTRQALHHNPVAWNNIIPPMATAIMGI